AHRDQDRHTSYIDLNMPSFWTADVPLAQIQVRIQSAASVEDDGSRKLTVPSTVYTALRQSLLRRHKVHGLDTEDVGTADK
ncbi:hypothetical protein LPJ73_006123, partial [Coemansia sp. RSA 2703]